MDESMYTLNSTEVYAVCYVIGSYTSNAWKSGNPHSGIYKTEIAKTLDAINCGYPGCNQGGWQLCKLLIAVTVLSVMSTEPFRQRAMAA